MEEPISRSWSWMNCHRGLETSERLKSEDGCRSVRIWIMTSKGRSRSVACCFEAEVLRWRFFWRREVRFERRGRTRVLSMSGSTSLCEVSLSSLGMVKVLTVG